MVYNKSDYFNPLGMPRACAIPSRAFGALERTRHVAFFARHLGSGTLIPDPQHIVIQAFVTKAPHGINESTVSAILYPTTFWPPSLLRTQGVSKKVKAREHPWQLSRYSPKSWERNNRLVELFRHPFAAERLSDSPTRTRCPLLCCSFQTQT